MKITNISQYLGATYTLSIAKMQLLVPLWIPIQSYHCTTSWNLSAEGNLKWLYFLIPRLPLP